MSSSIDLRLLSPLPFPGLLFHIYQQSINLEEEENYSPLPLVRHVKEFSRRSETLDVAVTKYNNKTANLIEGIKADASEEEDGESKRLTEKLVNINRVLYDYLDGLLPILREQKESVKQLDDYLCPPTVELFHKKADGLLKNAPAHRLPSSKRNTCAICMEAEANCIIARSCGSTPRGRPRCEHDTCKCGPTMCRQCLLTHYWTSTNKGTKSYAKCVCCRAEFCMRDIFPVEYEPEPARTTATTTTTSTSTSDNSQYLQLTKETLVQEGRSKSPKSDKRVRFATSTDAEATGSEKNGKRDPPQERDVNNNNNKRPKRRKTTSHDENATSVNATSVNTTTSTTTTTQSHVNNTNEPKERELPQERYSLRSSTRNPPKH